MYYTYIYLNNLYENCAIYLRQILKANKEILSQCYCLWCSFLLFWYSLRHFQNCLRKVRFSNTFITIILTRSKNVEKYLQSQRLFIHFKLSTAANTLTFCVCRSLCVTWFMRPAIPSNGQLSGNRRESIFPRGSPNSYISGSRPRILSRTECNVHRESIIHVSQNQNHSPE